MKDPDCDTRPGDHIKGTDIADIRLSNPDFSAIVFSVDTKKSNVTPGLINRCEYRINIDSLIDAVKRTDFVVVKGGKKYAQLKPI